MTVVFLASWGMQCDREYTFVCHAHGQRQKQSVASSPCENNLLSRFNLHPLPTELSSFPLAFSRIIFTVAVAPLRTGSGRARYRDVLAPAPALRQVFP